jgi:hypothetical protein
MHTCKRTHRASNRDVGQGCEERANHGVAAKVGAVRGGAHAPLLVPVHRVAKRARERERLVAGEQRPAHIAMQDSGGQDGRGQSGA